MLQLLKLVELALAFSVTIKLELPPTDSFLLLGLLEKLAAIAALTEIFKLLSWLFTLEVVDWLPSKFVSLLASAVLKLLLFDWDFWTTSDAKFNEFTSSIERISSDDVWGNGDIDEAEDDEVDEEELFVGDEELEAIDDVPGNDKWAGMFLIDVE